MKRLSLNRFTLPYHRGLFVGGISTERSLATMLSARQNRVIKSHIVFLMTGVSPATGKAYQTWNTSLDACGLPLI